MAKRIPSRRGKPGKVYWREDAKAWYCTVSIDGKRTKRRCKDCKTAKQADKYLDDMIAELREAAKREKHGPTNDVLLSEVQERFLEYHRARSRPGYVRRLGISLAQVINSLGVSKVSMVTREAAERYLVDRTKERVAQTVTNEEGEKVPSKRIVTPRTANTELGHMKTMLSWAEARGLIKSNPIAKVEPLPVTRADQYKVRRALTEEEVTRLLAASNERQRLIWLTFLSTGLRKNELSELLWSDVDLERGFLTVRAEVAKTGSEDSIPVPSALVAELRRHYAQQQVQAKNQDRAMPSKVFPPKCGKSIYGNLRRSLSACVTKAKVNPAGIDVHSLRKTFITHLIRAGVNPKTVQRLARHKTFAQTMDVYTEVFPVDLVQGAEQLPFLQEQALKRSQISPREQKAAG